MRRPPLSFLIFLLFLAVTTASFSGFLYRNAAARSLKAADAETETFRSMQLSDQKILQLHQFIAQTGMKPGEILAVLSVRGLCADAGTLPVWRRSFLRDNRDGFEAVAGAYGAVWNDVTCFPVDVSGIVYENSWMFERTYGGRRGHEGTDLIPPENLSGYYPVLSMTDGIVEQTGWLEKGGYRIGIRSESGGYFYYAHLDSYARSFTAGETVSAGEVLGLMGDSGYGPEGTTGKFDVHLHLGIYIATEHYEELSVNPYWVLRWLQAGDDKICQKASLHLSGEYAIVKQINRQSLMKQCRSEQWKYSYGVRF